MTTDDHFSFELRIPTPDSIATRAWSMMPGWAAAIAAPRKSLDQLAAELEARRAAGRVAHGEHVANWEALRASVPEGPVSAALLAVLDLHKPNFDDHFSEASDCEACMGSGYEVEPTPWPCETYTTIRDNLTGQDGRHD